MSMELIVYGGGCLNCQKLARNAKAAAEELGLDYELKKVEDYAEIAKAGIMSTPALAIDGDIKFKGQVATKEEIMKVME